MNRKRTMAPLILAGVVGASLVAVAGLSLWAASTLVNPRPSTGPSAEVAQPPSVWSLTLPDARGRQHDLGQWRGKVLALNFWATWCPPCREEMPVLARAQALFSPQGVQVVGLSIDTPSQVARFEDERPVGYPLLIGGTDLLTLSAAWGNSAQAMPFTAFFDRQGKLAAVHLGPLSEPALAQQLGALLQAD